MPMHQYATQVMQRCEQLAKFSQHPEYIDRRYLTEQHKQANKQVAEWMQLADMRTWQDEAGNQWGRYSSANRNAKTLIMGSHLDTVPNSGMYDGILGVLLPLSFIQYLKDHHISLPFNIDIVGFADEEGTRFGTTLLGSRAVADTWEAKWGCLTDQNGKTLAAALREFGLNLNHIHKAAINPADILGFVEIHIEQGPVLESQNLPVGIVTGIAGAKRFAIEVHGHAGHAGTVPMNLRQDALVGAAEMIILIEQVAIQHNVVATVGQISSASHAVNVISGKVDISLDVRSQNNEQRDACIEDMLSQIELKAQNRGLKVSVKPTHEADATPCDPDMITMLSNACKRSSVAPFLLSSGAGHDAMAMAPVCPTGMLFMRCAKGLSHHPEESVNFDDVKTTLAVIKSLCEIQEQSSQNNANLVV